MLRKTVIGALVVALTPALAFAAPMTAKAEMTTKPAVTHTMKHVKKTPLVKKAKADKIRLIQKHRTAKKALKV